MSLTSLLLGKGAKATDSDLDALFTRTKVEVPVPKSAVVLAKASTSKSKIAPPEEIIKQAEIAKAKAGSRSSTSTNDKTTAEKSSKKKNKSTLKEGDSAAAVEESSKSGSKQKQIEAGPSSTSESSKKRRRGDSNSNNTTVDDTIVRETLLNASVDGSDEEDGDESDDEEDDGLPLVHESLLLGGGKDGARSSTAGLQPRAKKQARHLNESKSDRDARTTFVGNVPIACVTNKSSKKALVRHLISSLPSEYQSITKLESIRFRSLQLATPAFTDDGRDNATTPTSQNNNDNDDEDEDDEEQVDRSNNHARKRARKWKTGEVDSQNGGKTPKFLTASQKKKIGFIKGQVHEKASSCIAYIVWDIIDSPASTSTSTSKAPTSSIASTTPQEIASMIVKYGNNTIFEDFTLRVDHVKGATSTLPEGQTEQKVEISTEAKRSLALEQKARLEEEKRTLYIGSLDFEEKEQAIRELCEKLMAEERGEPTSTDGDTGKVASYVERVRLVRDAETGLGKGFAYVMFKDRECVDEMLSLDSTRVKLSKRKLRLERCKTSSAKAAAANKAAKEAAYVARKEKQTADRKQSRFDASKLPTVPSVPRAPRPDIGDQLKSLSKEERKALKSSDDDRLTRRLEKKQARREAIKVEKQKEVLDRKVKSVGGSSYKARVDPAKEGTRKKRMRSDNAVFAKNRKKTI